jgi:hypothetical protein
MILSSPFLFLQTCWIKALQILSSKLARREQLNESGRSTFSVNVFYQTAAHFSVDVLFRLLTTFVPEPTDHGLTILVKSGQAYPAIYKRLVAGEAINCAVKGTTFDALPAPVAIIMDYFDLAELKATRAITGYTIPVTAIIASGAGPAVKLYGPESIGGVGDFGARIDAEVARTGRDPTEVGWEVCNRINPKITL